MIDLYYWPTPNGHKITVFLEEAALDYRIIPVNIGKGEQFQPDFLKIAPNNRMPAIVDTAPTDGGDPISLFESGAILLYLAHKTGRFGGASPRDHVEVVQWLMWQMGGLGPMAGQNHHFTRYAPEQVPYAIDRYVKETNRLYGVLDRRLADRAFVAGADYSIADMAIYPWIVPHALQGQDLTDTPHLRRWFDAIAARPATIAAYAKGAAIREASPVMTDEQRRILFGPDRVVDRANQHDVNATQRARAARFVVATVFLDAIGFGIVMPVLPQVVMALGHVGLADATRIGGWLGVIYAAVQFLTGPLMGNLGDRFGRRPVLLGSLGGFALDYALMGFAPSLGWLFLGRALAGLFGASYGPAGAAMADISAPEDRARHFGMIGGAFGIGFVVGPAIGGLLGEMGPRAPFHAAAILAGINFLFGLVTFPETLAPENRRGFSWARANPLGALLSLRRLPGILPIALAMFWWDLATMVYPATWSYFTIAAYGWSPGMIGASLALVGLLMAANQVFLVGRTVTRFGERGAAAIGMTACLIAFVGYTLIRQGWMVFPVLAIGSLQAMVMPSIQGMMSRRAPADAQGEVQGFNGCVMAIGAILAPLIYNPTLAWFTGPDAPAHFPAVVFVMAAAGTLVAIATLILTRRVPAGETAAL